MKSRISLQLGLAVAVALLFGASRASADMETFDLTSGNSGISGFTGPYAHVVVNLTDSTHATVTFTSLTNSGNIYLMGDGGTVGLNVNSSNFTGTVDNSSVTQPAGFLGWSQVSVGNNPSNEDGFGKFNYTLDSFDGYQHSITGITIDLTNNSGMWSSASDVLLANSNGSFAAAHIFVTSEPADPNGGALSTGYAANGGAVATPAPSAIVLAGIGALCLVGFMVFPLRRKGVAAA